MTLSSKKQTNMRVAIVGSRNFTDYGRFERAVDESLTKFGYARCEQLVSGGARGVDTLVERYARERDIELRVFAADWSTHGRAAGPIRNAQIEQYATHAIAFPSRNGRGTQDTMRRFARSGKPLEVHWIDD